MSQKITVRQLQNGRLYDISGQSFAPLQLTRAEATELRDKLTLLLRARRAGVKP